MKEADTIAFECVRPSKAHARLIMEWRNDPETLKMSYHSTPKVWDSFFSEFISEFFSFPDLPSLFAVVKGQPAAFLRLGPTANPDGLDRRCFDISLNGPPGVRRLGLGRMIRSEIQSWAAQQGYDDIYAEVKKDNV